MHIHEPMTMHSRKLSVFRDSQQSDRAGTGQIRITCCRTETRLTLVSCSKLRPAQKTYIRFPGYVLRSLFDTGLALQVVQGVVGLHMADRVGSKQVAIDTDCFADKLDAYASQLLRYVVNITEHRNPFMHLSSLG